MKNYLLLCFIFVSNFAYSIEVSTYGSKTLVRPFGYINHRRPPVDAQTVTIFDESIEFSAQQVCGYTDWSTAVIKLPRELLTMKYWEKVGSRLAKQATDSVLAITGALPSMLACNVSPTFCAILNRAEALAQANLRFTFDSCQMLEGLNDKTGTALVSLSSCVKEHTNKGMASNAAVESCILGSKDAGSTKNEKSQHVSAQAKESFNPRDFFKEACKETEYPKYSSSRQAYSVSEKSCTWLKEFFPGISMTASAKVKHGGTFWSSAAEKKYEDEIERTGIYLVELVDLMHALRYGLGTFSSQGPLPRHLVINHEKVWDKLGVDARSKKLRGICYPSDGESCKTDLAKLPPVYRLSLVGNLPALLVHPATLYEIVEVVPKDSTPSVEYYNKDSQLSFVLEHLIQSIAYANTQDVVRDANQRAVDACAKEPKLQSAAAQENCKANIAKLKAEKESLRIRSETDRNHIQAQIQFYSELERLKASRVQIRPEGKDRWIDPISDPKNL